MPEQSDELTHWVIQSMYLLLDGQVSDTIILSSHKLNTILEHKCGVNLKIDRIGRYLARFSREHKLKRLTTKIPKYEIKKELLLKILKSYSIQTT
ncbi:MAG: hypothetical protein DRO88_08385 [Promethearchaeia archaeon]|nr:MAG: hypothetical protein DRO88_08385 [Candidatus Lokiarchaeia archaeon]